MRAQHPDVVAQIEQQAAETARTQERARIEAIDSIAASVGDAQLVRDAKYGETPCTAEQLALKAMQKQAALGAKHLKDAKADNDESGAAASALPLTAARKAAKATTRQRWTPSSASTTPPSLRTEVRSNEQETGRKPRQRRL